MMGKKNFTVLSQALCMTLSLVMFTHNALADQQADLKTWSSVKEQEIAIWKSMRKQALLELKRSMTKQEMENWESVKEQEIAKWRSTREQMLEEARRKWENGGVATTPGAAAVDQPGGILPAFPGAEGFGALSKGGRGGRVIEVTNLNDSGSGSFRAAVEASGPRIVVFRTGGTIDLDSNVEITDPYLTIAGQTATGDGIQIRGAGLRIGTHDVIVRYIRFRRGNQGPGGSNSRRGLMLYHSSDLVHDIIIDHSSFGWQQDDNNIYGRTDDITYQWNIFAEANSPSGDYDGDDGKGLMMGNSAGEGDALGDVSIHHNLLHSNFMRNPNMYGDGPIHLVNNVIYNWGMFGSQVLNRGNGTRVNVIGNTYVAGPDSSASRYEFNIQSHVGGSGNYEQPPGLIYVHDNFGPHRDSASDDEWAFVGICDWAISSAHCVNPAPQNLQRSIPWPAAPISVTIQPAAEALQSVIDNAGATLPTRDAVDTRLINEFKDRTGSLGGTNEWPFLAQGTPRQDTDHDGMPDTWETVHGLDPSSTADGSQTAPSGYTWVEEYLHSLAGS
ncbi:MAG: hypothetical protein L0H63_08710 [Nitrococcus sp.]|nr:hypothetical protein [Nitrococcus sp.]